MIEFTKNHIFFNGQIYDSYSKIIDIFNAAKNELIIIDGYADKTLLDIISKINIKIVLITKTKGLLSKLDIEKYNSQYDNLNIIYDDTFHDRYFILDRKEIYLCGSSINYIGYRGSSIIQMNDNNLTYLPIVQLIQNLLMLFSLLHWNNQFLQR